VFVGGPVGLSTDPGRFTNPPSPNNITLPKQPQDIATADSIFLRQAPAADAKDARTALRRLQESGVGVLVPVSELKAAPIPNAIALFSLGEIPAVSLVVRFFGWIWINKYPHNQLHSPTT
jgi:hypothetical protein